MQGGDTGGAAVERPKWQQAMVAGTRGAANATGSNWGNVGSATANAVRAVRKVGTRKPTAAPSLPTYDVFDSPISGAGYGSDNG